MTRKWKWGGLPYRGGDGPAPAWNGNEQKTVRRQNARVAAQKAASAEHRARFGGGKGGNGKGKGS